MRPVPHTVPVAIALVSSALAASGRASQEPTPHSEGNDRAAVLASGPGAGAHASIAFERHAGVLPGDAAPEIRRARKVAQEARAKLDRYLDAVEKGMGPALYVERSRAAQAELAAAQAVLEAKHASAGSAVTEAQLRELLCLVGGVVGLLQDADADERRQFYQSLGLNLAYQRVGGREKVAASLAMELCVGGGFDPMSTPALLGMVTLPH